MPVQRLSFPDRRSLTEIRSMNSNDLILSCKWCLAFTSILLLYGLPFAATCVAAFGLLLFPFQSKSFRHLFRDLRKWVLLSTFALAASFGCYLILKLASQIEVQAYYSYGLWLLGTAAHELTGGFLAYCLYMDYTKEKDDKKNTNHFLEVRIQVLKGRNLVAKDTNIFGKPSTSDPYVKIFHNNHYVGETAIVWKTLNPEWEDEQFHLPIVQKQLSRANHLEFCIVDRDKFSSDDPMGAVKVHIPKELNTKVCKWYKVGKGTGKYFSKDASGELQVEVELRQLFSRRFRQSVAAAARNNNNSSVVAVDPRQLMLSNRNLFLSTRQNNIIQVDPAMPAKSTRRLMTTPEIIEEDDEDISDSQTDLMSLQDEIASVSSHTAGSCNTWSGPSRRKSKTLSPFVGKKRFSQSLRRLSLSPNKGNVRKRKSFLPGKLQLKQQYQIS